MLMLQGPYLKILIPEKDPIVPLYAELSHTHTHKGRNWRGMVAKGSLGDQC